MPPKPELTCSFQFDCLNCGISRKFVELRRACADSAEKNSRIIRSQYSGKKAVLSMDLYNAAEVDNSGLESQILFNSTPEGATPPY